MAAKKRSQSESDNLGGSSQGPLLLNDTEKGQSLSISLGQPE